jgi:thioredoxin
MTHPVTITEENWEAEVMKSDIPVVVDLWATWCPPCRAIAPILDEMATRWEGKVKVAKVNVDEQRRIYAAFDTQSIPTLGIVYQGGLVGKVVGFGGRAAVEGLFEDVAALPEKLATAETSAAEAEKVPNHVPEAPPGSDEPV